MEANDGSKKQIDFASFDFLYSAEIQIATFGKHFLCHLSRRALTSDICAKLFKLRLNLLGCGHTPLSRESSIDLNGV